MEELVGHGVDCQPGGRKVVERNQCAVTVSVHLRRIVKLDALGASTARVKSATNLREVARPFFVGKDRDEISRRGVVKPLALVISEVEQLILLDGTADGTAEHIP